MVACQEIGEGKRHVPELLGDIKIKPIAASGAYTSKMDSRRANNAQIVDLLARYAERKQKVGDRRPSSSNRVLKTSSIARLDLD